MNMTMPYPYRAAKDFEQRSQHYEPSLGCTPDEGEHEGTKFDECEFVPHFQRVSVSGEDTAGVSHNYVSTQANPTTFTNMSYFESESR
jgi:hypothetical protein